MYTSLEERQIRQYIDAEQARKALVNAEQRAGTYRGSMFWKTVKGKDYLFREYPNGTSRSLGPRSSEIEGILEEFKKGKSTTEHNLKELHKTITAQVRMNSALRVGRTPNVVVGLLEELRKAGLQDHFMVIGTNALYAYETQAGVRFGGDVTATTDIDILWDSRKVLTLVEDGNEHFNKHGLLGLIKKVDSSFELQKGEEYRASNSQGYMVDLIKRRPESFFDDKEQGQLIANPDDFWAAKIKNMDWLLSSPKFRQIVVATNGSMAEMVTVDPRAFVFFKNWLSQKEDRDPMKKPRDLAQARAVFELVQEQFPHMNFDQIHAFPERMRDEHAMAVLSGVYLGKIVARADGKVTQDLGRGRLFSHTLANLDKVPEVGDLVQITNDSKGRGAVVFLNLEKQGGPER
jgi:hypothetical protein